MDGESFVIPTRVWWDPSAYPRFGGAEGGAEAASAERSLALGIRGDQATLTYE